jgi:glycosyltransferase involved in cell wall biosynthesis
MTTLQFETGSHFAARTAIRGGPAGPFVPRPRRRLAIVSSCDELCGVAAYTRFLERQLRDAFEVRVFDLDQYLLRNADRRVRRRADQHIREICEAIAGYDAVNLQFEHGTLGIRPGDIDRRFRQLVEAARRISVTYHTVFPIAAIDKGAVIREIRRFNLFGAAELMAMHRRIRRLIRGPVRTLRRAQAVKPTAIIVHNRRDLRQMKHVSMLREVYDHPLSFVAASEADEIRRAAARRRFPLLDAVPENARLIGVFGFFGRHKGIETAVRALHHLPEDRHLLIFGGVHPNAIRPQQVLDPVIASVFEAGFVDTSLAERLVSQRRDGAPGLSFGFDAAAHELLAAHPKDLSHRLHFLGPVGDADFLAGMALCDAVVFPYIEVGQSASGPISQALELGCRIIAARTHTFLQFARYHRDTIEFFDIGNHVELAARIRARPQYDLRQRRLDYTVATNAAVYVAANGGAAAVPAAAPRPIAAED